MKPLILLRPEPGLSATAARARAQGLTVIECALFEIRPLAWSAPPASTFDAVLLTSANAVHQAGPALAAYRYLPVLAVGEATASAARDAGLRVGRVGQGSAAELLAHIAPDRRLLHLRAADAVDVGRAVTSVPVYESKGIGAVLPPLPGCVVAVHSPRAGRQLAELTHDRAGVSVAAISAAAAAACGWGWDRIEAATLPDDPTLLALAARLCQDSTDA